MPLSAARRSSRAVWSDPQRKRATLELFARTEADGGRDLSAAAARTRDPWLREHLERHASDEERHARLFRECAAALETGGGPRADVSERNLSLAPERADHDAHGFMSANLYDELGEVAYVAMLHVAERRAAQLFAMHRDLLRDDPQTRAVFERILKDEVYHVAYTGTAL
ncbi:MAG TPA: ferritin-like domain-containing protein, partial [Planctomycetota bacterium]|nr:ferritin-like domain-containing protein [Planctomycetota bacterium]